MIRRIFVPLLCLFLFSGGLMSCSGDDRLDGAFSAGALWIEIESNPLVSAPGESFDTGFSLSADTVTLTLENLASGESHTWDGFDAYQQGQYYFAGDYIVSAVAGDPMAEGFGVTAWSGQNEVNIYEDSQTHAVIVMRPTNAMLRISFDSSVTSCLDSISFLVHTPGGIFHTYCPDETRLLCLNPGRIELYAVAVTTDGRKVRFPALDLTDTSAATLYDIEVSCKATATGPEVTVSAGEISTTRLLDEAFLSGASPVITSSWDVSSVYRLPEGDIPTSPFTAQITSSGTLSSLILATRSLALSDKHFPDEIDLLSLSPEESALLSALGLDCNLSSSGGSVNFGNLLGELVYLTPASAVSAFTLIAVSSDGQVSDPVTLTVESSPVEIEVSKVYPVAMGIDHARIDVKCQASGFMRHVEVAIHDTSTYSWMPVDNVTVAPVESEEQTYSLSFGVPYGSAPIDVRVLYCEEVRATLSLPRTQPPFTVSVDPYATMAAIRVEAADPALLPVITRELHVYVDNSEAPVYTVYPDLGILSLIGLSPSTTYTLCATMMTGVDDPDFTPELKFTTEPANQLTNSDFEERQSGPTYKELPSGGRYAQTVVDIFNWQHFTEIATEVPKNWATVNAKTFCTSSTNHNTWYMQPSAVLTRDPVFSQSFAVELTSVAFDPRGEEIPPYSQKGQPYLDYSPIVPDIAYRAAGKLFLGSYSFDPATMTEKYDEGIEWSTRPTSLNGYYRFFPAESARADYGLVTVEVLGTVDGAEVSIASGIARLPLAMSYTAFSVPLDYKKFGVKATRLKVMFSSSASPGDIAHETTTVITDPDPITATSTGSRLWIDNVTLAY